MSIKPIIPSIDVDKNKKQSIKINKIYDYTPSVQPKSQKQVSFTGVGFNPIVSLMDFIEANGYAASFVIQDGLGFIAPRVGKGILRGGKEKKDANGNPILDKNGKPKHELNWAYARKEAVREVITGPSAFLIPVLVMKGIKSKFGRANNAKLNYINNFEDAFVDYVSKNSNEIIKGTDNRQSLYETVYKDLLKLNINSEKGAMNLSENELQDYATKMAKAHIDLENINAENLTKEERVAKINNLGPSVEEIYTNLRKSRIGGVVDETKVQMGTLGFPHSKYRPGKIGEFKQALTDIYKDCANSSAKFLKEGMSEDQIKKCVQEFMHFKKGSRILTNLGLFGLVAAFYTQIPKLYNIGLKGNPALQDKNLDSKTVDNQPENDKKEGVSFTGRPQQLIGKFGEGVFSNKYLKYISDLFEFNGSIISGKAMPFLLYGFCIPPRLAKAQDKYDFGEILLRDMTSFTALLFGAKALGRLFSDGFTKYTGLALNRKDLKDRNLFQKTLAYLNPVDGRHKVLSTGELVSKYTNIDQYKDGILGFVDFIKQSGGNVKKVFTHDKNVKSLIEQLGQEFKNKSYSQMTAEEIEEVLKMAKDGNHKLLDKIYDVFKTTDNGLLAKAKTCNSTFGFISTIILIPGLIYWLTTVCEKMTNNRIAQEKNNKPKQDVVEIAQNNADTNKSSMVNFLK